MKNFIKNWRTTIPGIIVIILSCYLIITSKIGVAEFGTLISLGIGLLFAKDAQNKTFTDCEVKDLKKQVETKDCDKP